MFPYGKKKIRVFPFRPTPERGSFIDFIEETGTNAFLIEAVKKLYELPNKPENPIEWLRLHFKYLAPDRTKEMQETEELLKIELSELESKLIDTDEEEAQNLEILTKLENEHKNITMASGKIYHYEDFRKYLHHPDDYHHRIKPDPLYQASKSDMLLADEDRDSNLIIELVPYNKTKFTKDDNNRNVPDQQVYADYPATYFPEKVLFPISPEEDDEVVVEEDEGAVAKVVEEKKAVEEDEGDEARPPGFTESLIGERGLTGTESIIGEATARPSQVLQQQQEAATTQAATSKRRRSTNETINTKKTGKTPGKPKAPKMPKIKSLPKIKPLIKVPNREPSNPNQAERISYDSIDFIESDLDPLLKELEPVDSSFWKNDFSVTGGLQYENLCEPNEHFDYEPVRLTENTPKIFAGGFRRFDSTDTEAKANCNKLGICNRNWIMDPNLVGPSFAEKLVYNGVPYDEEVAAEDAVEYYEDEDEDENDEDNWNTSVLSQSENVEESNDDECCESPSTCECECEESSCSTSYCRTSTSNSSYKEDDNTNGKRTATTPLETSATDNEHKMEIPGEYDEMYNQTVAALARFSQPATANVNYK